MSRKIERKLTLKQRDKLLVLLSQNEKQHYLAAKFGVRQPAIAYYKRRYLTVTA